MSISLTLTYESSNISATACQGDPDCGQTEVVMLITQAEVLATTVPNITIQNLPDGNYRYWSGTHNQAIKHYWK